MSTTPVVTPAESAPAIEESPVEVSVQERLDHATSKELDTWRKTGDIPAVKIKEPEPKTETPAPSKESTAAKPGENEPPAKVETAPASEPARTQRKKDAAARVQELLADRKRDREEREELRRELDELKSKVSQPVEKRETAASQPVNGKATEGKAKPKLSDNDSKTGKPFASLEAWSDAVDEWNDARVEEKLSARLSAAEQTRTQSEQAKAIQETVFNRSKPAMENHKDFLQVAADPKLPIPKGSPVESFLFDSENPGEVAYYLGKHPEVLAEFYGCEYDPETGTWDYGDYDQKTGKFTNHVNPIQQVRRLTEIERELTAALKKVETAPANPAPPRLPKPPTEVSGRHSAPVDEAEAALARGDTAGYMRIVNAREAKASRR